jgi:RNA polymerase sigma factor (sigma-70 family)
MAELSARPEPPADDPAAFRAFAERLAAGEERAAAELLARYSERLLRLAGSRLGPRLAAKSDPEDAVQSALRTFYRRLGEGRLVLRDWSNLSGLLSVITLRKCRRDARLYSAAQRDIRREVPLSVSSRGTAVRERPIVDDSPPPDEVAAFTEILERLLAGLGERDRRAVELVLAGEPAAAVARDLGCSKRTIYRTIERIRDQLLDETADDGDF